MKMVSYENDSNDFLSVLVESSFPESPSPQEFEMESQYRKAIAGDKFLNVSFAIRNQGEIEAIILCHKEDRGLTYAGRTPKIITHRNHKRIYEYILDTIDTIAVRENLDCYKISDDDLGNKLSNIGKMAYDRGGLPTCRFEGLIDLMEAKEVIHQNIRKSFKSLVNQGDREINHIIINKMNPDKEKFDLFRQFHKQVAGRITRPLESWEAQFDMIKAGCAELILGKIATHGLVSAALCIDHGNTTHYGVAVYDRDLFDKPLGHASVYKSVMSAKDRGQGIFSLGIISQRGTVSDKEHSIGTFKKGFCDRLSNFLEWKIEVGKG